MSVVTEAGATPQELPEAALHHLDLMRGVAAIAVLFGHVRGLFLVDMGDLTSPSFAMRALYVLAGFGHQAVVVFFVLSGFFIGTSVIRSKERGSWSWEGFLIRRFARLYVVLVPALALTALLDLGGMRLFGTDNVYGAKLVAPFIAFEDARLTTRLPTLLGNLFFLQHVFVLPYGTNGPLWSLGYEFWSYVLFPLLVFGLARRASARARALGLLLALPIVLFGSFHFLRYFGIWLLGALVSYLWPHAAAAGRVPRWAVAPALAVFAGLLLGARVSRTWDSLWDYAAAAGTSGLLVVLLARRGSARKPALGSVYGPFAARLASFSYTLYLVHYPMLAFVSAALGRTTRWQPTTQPLLFAALLFWAVIVVSYGIAQLTERHTDGARRWLQDLCGSVRRVLNGRAVKRV